MDRPRSINEEHVQSLCLIILTFCLVGFSLYFLRPILVPFLLAVFLAFVLTPVLDLQTRYLRFPRILALIVTLLVGFFLIFVLSGLTVSSVTSLANNSERYERELETRVRDAYAKLPFDALGIEDPGAFDPMTVFPEDLLDWILNRAAGTFTGIVSQSVLVLLFVVFLLLGRSARPKPLTGTALEIERSVKRYIITKVVTSAATGALVFLTLNLLSIPFAIAFGALAFMLNFIPSIGSIIATFLPLPVLLLADVTTTTMIMAIAIPGMIQFSIGNLIEPKILGDSLDLHPVVILLALIFWGMIWGPIGMLLAAPLTAIMKIVLSKIQITKPFADAFGGRLESLLNDVEAI